MTRRPATLVACLALAGAGTAIAACGSSDDDKSSDAPATTRPTNTAPQASSATSGDEVKVTMKNIKFVPEVLTAKVGQRIVWENTDNPPHTVTASDGADFDSGNMARGDTFQYTPKKVGKIAYFCKIHDGQTGSITVTK